MKPKKASRKDMKKYHANYYKTVVRPFLMKLRRDRLKKKFADLGIPWEEGVSGGTG